MSFQLRIIESQSNNVYHNLALEEWLWQNLSDNEFVFFLYCNSDSIVIGRNQNPWIECSIPQLYRDDIKLARRSTGGGAVFHDMGNLNFSFILPKKYHCVHGQIGILQQVLHTFGIDAKCDDQFYHLWVNGYKISGQAFLYRRHKVIHHGTLLIDSNLQRLSQYLSCAKTFNVKTTAVSSKPAKVMNLKDYCSSLSIGEVKLCLKEAVRQYWMNKGLPSAIEQTIRISFNQIECIENNSVFLLKNQDKAWHEIYQRHLSWPWIFAKTPPFQCTYPLFLDKKHQCLLYLHVQNGYIQELSLEFDFSSLINKESIKIPHVNYLRDYLNEMLFQVQFHDEQLINAINQLESKFKMKTSSN